MYNGCYCGKKDYFWGEGWRKEGLGCLFLWLIKNFFVGGNEMGERWFFDLEVDFG